MTQRSQLDARRDVARSPKPISPIGRLILDSLADQEMSQSELARRLAGPVASPSRVESVRRLLQKWIRGDNEPGLDYVARLASVCGKQPEFFVAALKNPLANTPVESKTADSDLEALAFARQAVELFSEASGEGDVTGRLTRSEITNLFPQFNPEQVLIDSVDELVPGKYVRATKRALLSDWSLDYWYRGTHVVPGVMLVEALAQAAALSLGALSKNRTRNVLCAAFNQMKFRRIVQDGEEVTLESSIVYESGPIAQADVVARVGDEVAVRGRLTLAVH